MFQLPRRAVFLDRDGVINRDSPDFIRSYEQLHLLPGAAQACARLHQAGFILILVTNQSGIARGLLTEADLAKIHQRLIAELQQAGAKITDIYYCPHGPNEGCACRKPGPGMLLTAIATHNISAAVSFMVGDRPADIACGKAAGCTTILALSGKTLLYNPADFAVPPDFVAADLTEAAAWILVTQPTDVQVP